MSAGSSLDSCPPWRPTVPLLDAAGEDLITGLVEAFAVHALIQRAIGVVMATERCTAQDAYLSLRVEPRRRRRTHRYRGQTAGAAQDR